MPELLTTQTIEQDVASNLPGWEYSGGKLRRTYERKGFLGATNLLNAIAFLAHQANHHPDMTLHDYNQLTITLMTHVAGGVTQHDLDLAHRIVALVQE